MSKDLNHNLSDFGKSNSESNFIKNWVIFLFIIINKFLVKSNEY